MVVYFFTGFLQKEISRFGVYTEHGVVFGLGSFGKRLFQYHAHCVDSCINAPEFGNSLVKKPGKVFYFRQVSLEQECFSTQGLYFSQCFSLSALEPSLL